MKQIYMHSFSTGKVKLWHRNTRIEASGLNAFILVTGIAVAIACITAYFVRRIGLSNVPNL